MKKILTIIILSFFLPFLSFAAEPSPESSILPSYNIFDSLRSVSSRVELHLTPENAKEKGFWVWAKESINGIFSRARRATDAILKSVKEKRETAFNFIEMKIKEKIGENIWQSSKQIAKDSINYIDKKLKN